MTHALSYYGGKSVAATRGVNAWIRSLLPSDLEVTYCETHAGMLGILLSRPKARIEIANDLNSRIVNWFDVVRTQRSRFEDMLRFTPCAAETFALARSTIDEGTPLERAWKFHVVVNMSMFHTDGDSGGFGLSFNGANHNAHSMKGALERLESIRKRVEFVQFSNLPALQLLERMADIPAAVLYVDPPYETANTGPYAVNVADFAATCDALRQQRGRVAVSGYRDEWDVLGWERHERRAFASLKGVVENRTEVLWCNYTPEIQGDLL